MSGPRATAAAPVRPLSIGEQVAALLRDRIVDGTLADGDVLPKQEDLLVEFGVSKPSLREALRILEAEGLVHVRRGKFGGAVVRRPRVDTAAGALEVVLRSMDADGSDVVAALREIEPVCAALCAERTDRATAVVPRLRAVHEQALAAVDDLRAYTALARRFHEELVAACGNRTMAVLVGSLEAICSADSALWLEDRFEAAAPDGTIDAPIADARYRRAGLDDHGRILARIEAGDRDGAALAARDHGHGRRSDR